MKEIGKIVSVHGVDGDIVIAHHISNQNTIHDLSNLMIEIWKDSFIPFFIEKILGVSSNDFCIKFEDIDSREEAKKLLNKKVYVFDENQVEIVSQNEWAYLIGYQLFTQENSHIGTITDIYTNGFQVLIEMNYKDKLIQIPLHQDLIIELNTNHKTIKIEIADGLLEIWD